MTGHWAWVLLAVIFAGGVAIGGLAVSLAGSRREDRAYDEGYQAGIDIDEGAGFAFTAEDCGYPDSPGPAMEPGETPGRERHETAGPEAWEPFHYDRIYQWAHPHPIRATAPLTVIDWDALPWEERQLLTVWDWGRRMQAWVEDWDRDDLEAA